MFEKLIEGVLLTIAIVFTLICITLIFIVPIARYKMCSNHFPSEVIICTLSDKYEVRKEP